MDPNLSSESNRTIMAFQQKMRNEGINETVINSFTHYYKILLHNQTAYIDESAIVPVKPGEIPDMADLEFYQQKGRKALESTVIIKLNGGLGTTMGLEGPKSLIPIKNGLTFLDVTLKNTLHLNEHYGVAIPLLLMNSFYTNTQTLQALSQKPDRERMVTRTFLQDQFPKVAVSSLSPVSNPEAPQLEWNPPGHGNLLIALETSGKLDELIGNGYRYAFISNIDNLGATIDPILLGYFSDNQFDFLMEVTRRTEMDRKGGHLAMLPDGTLLLREISQCKPEDKSNFMNISRHPYFNTNNLWINLTSIKAVIKSGKIMEMPLVINRKRLHQLHETSPEVFQLESALGSSLSIFKSTSAVRVPRSRFAPVKNSEELLLIWSDYFILTGQFQIILNPQREHPAILIDLDPKYYGRLDQLSDHFPCGAPSLVACASLVIKGDIQFGANITISGDTELITTTENRIVIPDNASLTGRIIFS